MNIISNLPGFNVAFRGNVRNNPLRQGVNYNNALTYDKFEKSTNNISFKGESAFQQKIDKAANLFEEHIMNEQFSVERIAEIVGEFSDEIDVEKFNHSECNLAQSATIGY